MQPSTTFRILGLLVIIFSVTFITPIIVSLLYQEANHANFLWAFVITLSCGLFIWLPSASRVRKNKQDLYPRDGYVITVLFWLVLSLFGALPFMLQDILPMSFTDAFFESISGLTTTGATVMTGLDDLPKSLLFYRQQMQWLGGVGIIVIAVAVLPLLGIGGMQLYRTEAAGPSKNSKLTPRIAETAKALFAIYLVLTLSCATAYWIAGMTLFDAISHSFSTVAIGGFSTHDSSMGYFADNSLIMIITMVFMVLSELNFALHFYGFTRKSVGHYFDNTEAKIYLLLLTLAVLVTISTLQYYQVTFEYSHRALHSAFQAISILTTTGYVSDDFSQWPAVVTVFLLTFSMIGACAGSTGGGIKVMRIIILYKQSIRQMRLMIHPHAVFPIKINGRLIDDKISNSVWAFLGVYIAMFYLMTLLLMANGSDYLSAWSATVSSLSNLGPALGDFSVNYSAAPVFTKWLLCFGMLLGRLELFTLLVLFVPMFWKK